jgi:hypothetical protein
MRARRLQLKLYATPESLGDPERIVPIFHSWIREGRLDETLIDVARYGHVHQGPAVLLVGDRSDYAIDLSEGRPGLLTTRKKGAAPDDERIADVFRRALSAAHQLEREVTGLSFSTQELLLIAPDRLNLPNRSETFAAHRDEIAEHAQQVLGEVELVHEGGPEEPFSVRLRRRGAEPVAALLGRC